MELCTSDFTKTILGKIWPNLGWDISVGVHISVTNPLPGCFEEQLVLCLLSMSFQVSLCIVDQSLVSFGVDTTTGIVLPTRFCFVIGSAGPKGLQCTILPTLMHARCPIKARFSNYSPWTRHRRSLWSGKFPPWHQIFGFWGKTRPFHTSNSW